MGSGCPSVLNATFLFSRNVSSNNRYRYLHVSARKKLGWWSSSFFRWTSLTLACPCGALVCLLMSSAILRPACLNRSSRVANHSIALDSANSGLSG